MSNVGAEQSPFLEAAQAEPIDQVVPPVPDVVASRATDSIEWSMLAFELGLQGMAQEIATNSIVESYDRKHLRLALEPEILDLVNATIRDEITQAISSKLGVSLKLDLTGQKQLGAETPQQARIRELEEQRLAAIDAIKQEAVVQKLHQAFGAELVESSVKKVDV